MWLSGWVSYYFASTGVLFDRLSSFATADGSVSVFGWTCALHRCAFGDMHLSVPAGE
jgi:hypothetical protein